MSTPGAARPDDAAAIRALLSAAGLSLDGLDGAGSGVLVGREAGRIVAHACLEDWGDDGLLRSVVVAADRRGRGLGAALVGRLIERSRRRGHRAVYLLTDDAEGYFARFGFRRIDRTDVPPAIAGSPQFAGRTCAGAVVMMLGREARD